MRHIKAIWSPEELSAFFRRIMNVPVSHCEFTSYSRVQNNFQKLDRSAVRFQNFRILSLRAIRSVWASTFSCFYRFAVAWTVGAITWPRLEARSASSRASVPVRPFGPRWDLNWRSWARICWLETRFRNFLIYQNHKFKTIFNFQCIFVQHLKKKERF